MATLLQIDRVQYSIDQDGEDCEPLARLYFCTYCLCLRSADVLQLEIDSHFCPQTLDGMPPGEAAAQKNRSVNSWHCPSCFHTLSTKATSTSIPSAENPSKFVAKKSYYQACNFCRWTSRSVGIPDKDIVNGSWSEVENPSQPRIQKLLEYYKLLSKKEIAEAEQKKSTKKRTNYSITMQFQQKYGVSRPLHRKTTHVSALTSSLSALRLKEPVKEVTIDASRTLAVDEIERLPDDIYTKTISFDEVASAAQRLDQPSYKPADVSLFRPRKSTMFIKRSLRCTKCDHNIVKPEYNSSSIKFKIHLAAIQHIPEVRINKAGKLRPGERSRFVMSLINPTERVIHVTLMSHQEENKQKRSNTQVELPTSELLVCKYDETSEYAASEDADEKIMDDPNVVAFRSGNKIGFYIHCTPDRHLAVGDQVWIAFSFNYEAWGMTPISQILKVPDIDNRPESFMLKQIVYVNLGMIEDSDKA